MKNSALTHFLYKCLLTFFCIVFCSVLFVANSFAGIIVNSVVTTESRCANDGTVTINASSTPNPFLLFAIVSGPVFSPLQNSPVFSSLYPGTYTARLYDVNFDSLDVQFTVDGDYRSPFLSPVFINPTCPGFSDGEITCNPDTSRGRMPFSYQIISPFVSASQSSQVFNNLGAGSYDIRMTDSCGNYQTRNVLLNNSGTGLSYYAANNLFPYIRKIGCDTIEVSFQYQLYKEKRNIPLTLTVTTAAGTFSQQILPIVVDTFNYTPGLFYFVDTLYGLTYGDYLSLQLTDTCGVVMNSIPTNIAPYDFELQYFNAEVNCNVKLGAYFRLKAYPYYPFIPTQFLNPSSFTLIDVATGLLVDSMSCPNVYCGLVISPQTQGQLYQLTITDGCGDVWQQVIQWPTLNPPVVYFSNGYGCVDSSATLYVSAGNFLSGITVELLSGPSVLKSTKPGYAFTDSIIYPQIFYFAPYGGSIGNLPAGTYQYRISDSCGFSQLDSFSLSYIAELDYQYYIKRGCLGTNILYFYAQSTTPMAVSCTITAVGGNVLYQRTSIFGLDSINSLPPGAYAIEIYYAHGPFGGQYFDGYATSTLQDCWVLRDTIIIPPIPPTTFISNNTILCNGTAYVQLQVDSNTGVAPFIYEIISGPQVYSQQDSSYFVIPSFGNYVIRVGDACGNSTIQQISVDSAGFPPLVRNGSLCPGNNVTLYGISSAYFTYEWHFPNGFIYTGDSLVLNSLSAADTGLYLIYKIVNINGCTDTIFQSYHIGLNDMVTVNAVVCLGDSIQIGNNFYSLPGIYTDSLANISGCDSIVTTVLAFALPDTLNNTFSICSGDSVLSGNVYYRLPGLYMDTVTNINGCSDILFTTIIVNYLSDSVAFSLCAGDTIIVGTHYYFSSGIYMDSLISQLGCDSLVTINISVAPYKRDSINRTICFGDTYSVGLNTYSTTGIYQDTLATASCDSIITLNLTVAPYKRDSINRTICFGDTYAVGLNSYSTTGIYQDTLATASCDSIITLNLTVTPFKRDSINRTICFGDTYTVGLNTYSTTGIYQDTLTTASCDSIITLNLTVAPFKRDSINRTICFGDTYTVGLNTYSTTGIYQDTLTTVSCDSIVMLNLIVLPNKRDTITSVICPGENIVFGNTMYTLPGYYNDTLTTTSCDSIVTLNLTVDTNAWVTITATDTLVVSGTQIQLNASSGQQLNFLWSSSAFLSNLTIENPVATILVAAWITVNGIGMNGCKVIDSVYIDVEEDSVICEDSYLFIPSAFTPNEDGINDVFNIEGVNVLFDKMWIYNRWGEEIFNSKDFHLGWDGRFNGDVMAGIYVYKIAYFACGKAEKLYRKGKVYLLK